MLVGVFKVYLKTLDGLDQFKKNLLGAIGSLFNKACF